MTQEKEWFCGLGTGGGTQERPTILPLVVWALVIGLAIAAALYSARAAAEETKATFSSTDGSGNLVRIFDEPCAETPSWLQMRRAEMRYEGIDYFACWFAIGHVVIVLDSNGDATPIPAQSFKKDEPI